ncbi:MAG: hypothetical protein HYY13_02355 [Nitrospirae bacterium]|nr:hypothetical protein [Nitrospirota bacterium]
MKRMIGVAAAAVFTLAGTALAGEKVTLQGEVLDSACYLAEGEKGKAHEKCAQMCLKKGVPAALLTDDGKVLLLTAKHGSEALYDELKKLAAQRIEITGERIEKGGMAAIQLETIKGINVSSPSSEKHAEEGHMGGHMH